jgi:hypothetical protein
MSGYTNIMVSDWLTEFALAPRALTVPGRLAAAFGWHVPEVGRGQHRSSEAASLIRSDRSPASFSEGRRKQVKAREYGKSPRPSIHGEAACDVHAALGRENHAALAAYVRDPQRSTDQPVATLQ